MDKAKLTEYIKEKFSGELEVMETEQPEPYFIVKAQDIVSFARLIHDDPTLDLTFLMNLSGVDNEDSYQVVYNVCSLRHKHRVYIKVILNHDKPEIDTVRAIWPAADWFEREAWELFGINIKGHPNLKRFLLPDDWDQGFPMRKDWKGRDVVPFPER